MKVFKSKEFARFARENLRPDATLCRAVEEIHAGTVDAELGGGVYKQRLRRTGEGKSGGFRTIILLRWKQIAIFAFGCDLDLFDNRVVGAFGTMWITRFHQLSNGARRPIGRLPRDWFQHTPDIFGENSLPGRVGMKAIGKI